MRRFALLFVLWIGAAPGLAAQGAGMPVEFGGELRVRPEFDGRAAGFENDDAVLLRARFGARAEVADFAWAYVQLQVSRAFGEDPVAAGGFAGGLGLHQGYVDLSGIVGDVPAVLRVGRQEVRLGNERLVGAVGWSNTGRAFDAFRVTAGPGGDRWRLSALGAVVTERGRLLAPGLDPRRNAVDGTDHLFSGVYVEMPVADLFVLHDRNAAAADFDGVDRTTAGGRVSGSIGRGIRYDVEGAYQWGVRRASAPVAGRQDIGAWLVGARLASPVPIDRVETVRIGVDWLSGDDDPADAAYGAFSTLYATNHKFYGLMDLFLDPAAQTHDRGLIDGILGLELEAGDGLALEAVLHRFWFAETAAAAARDVGWELDVTLPYELADGVSVQAGYGIFRNGDGAAAADLGPAGDILHWGYVQLEVGF